MEQKASERGESVERQLYGAIFPTPNTAILLGAAGLTYSDLEKIFPERVLLARLDGIFGAWNTSYEALDAADKITESYPANGTDSRILYNYDHCTYRSTVKAIKINGVRQIEIKLSNDGFIYPPREALALNSAYNSDKVHHKRSGWARLSNESVKTHFESILSGMKSILGTGEGELLFGKVLYHEYEERIDFLFSDTQHMGTGSKRILVTFEPGYPEHFHENDEWDEF
jgi:hypothetical protein